MPGIDGFLQFLARSIARQIIDSHDQAREGGGGASPIGQQQKEASHETQQGRVEAKAACKTTTRTHSEEHMG